MDAIKAQNPNDEVTTRSALLADCRSIIARSAVSIRAEAVRELYGDEQPTVDDGLLGWVPNIAEQLPFAEATDGHIEVSLADWNAKVTPEVANKLHDDIRLRCDWSTLNDAKGLLASVQQKRVTTTARPVPSVSRAPIWPVLIAPLVAGAYYMVVKTAFERSITGVFGNIADVAEIDLINGTESLWGAHWFYRVTAEILAIGFGAFVAAGLARGRERVAALTGGVTISLVYAAWTGLLLLAWWDPEFEPGPEPWYQHAIGGLLVIAAPIVAVFASAPAQILNEQKPTGFSGINRLHFLWLFIAVHWYTIGLISPLALYLREDTIFRIGVVVPALTLLVPGCWGLALLSGYRGNKLHSAVRNLLGVIVLVLGFLIGVTIQFGLATLLQKL